MIYRSKQEVIAKQLPKSIYGDFNGFLAEANRRGLIENAANGYIIHDQDEDSEDNEQYAFLGDYVILGADGSLTVVDKEAFENSFELIGGE